MFRKLSASGPADSVRAYRKLRFGPEADRRDPTSATITDMLSGGGAHSMTVLF